MTDRWLVAHSLNGEREYIIHLHKPRFLVGLVEFANGSIAADEVHPIDPIPDDRKMDLLREAADVWMEYERGIEQKIQRRTLPR